MKKIVLFLMIFGLSSFNIAWLKAQKKEISMAKTAIKKGTNLAQAQQSITSLLADSVHQQNETLWNVLYEVLNKQYEQGNEKLYLKQKYDTAQLFSLTYDMLRTLEKADSISLLHNNNKRERSKNIDKNVESFHVYRANLIKGGMFFIGKQRYDEAYKMLNSYINMAYIPLFSRFHYEKNDPKLAEAAYLSVYCGYKMEDAKRTLRHAYLALKDTTHHAYLLQFLAEAYHLDQDLERYENALKEGFTMYPNLPFFFSRLLTYYLEHERYTDALNLVDNAAQKEGEKEEFLLAKVSVLFELKRFDDCISLGERLLAENDLLADAYLNVGLSYYNKAVMLDKKSTNYTKQEAQIKGFYQKARTYLESYRKLEPTDKEKWGYPLYTIYLNLNMGKEFDEIDKILRSKS